MNKTLNLASNIIIGLIVIGVSITIFLMSTTDPRPSLAWVSLIFVLLSEVLMFGVLIYLAISSSTSNKKIIRIGILSTLAVYWVLTIVLAIIRNVFSEHQIAFYAIQIILFAVAAIIAVSLNFVAYKVGVDDRTKFTSRQFMQSIENRLQLLVSSTSAPEIDSELETLIEKVKYTDKFGTSTCDDKITESTTRLEHALNANEGERTKELRDAIADLLTLINQRELELKQTKRGGF